MPRLCTWRSRCCTNINRAYDFELANTFRRDSSWDRDLRVLIIIAFAGSTRFYMCTAALLCVSGSSESCPIRRLFIPFLSKLESFGVRRSKLARFLQVACPVGMSGVSEKAGKFPKQAAALLFNEKKYVLFKLPRRHDDPSRRCNVRQGKAR